jgi:cardiolipin synthase
MAVNLLNVPNFITIARFFLIPAFVLLMLQGSYKYAILVFLFAGFTDVLDGYIARKYNMVTKCGQILDPLADKLLQFTALIMIAVTNVVENIWPIMAIIALKEISMGVGSLILWKSGIVVSANWYGKMSTIVFYAAIVFAILVPSYGKAFLAIAVIAALFAFAMYVMNYLSIRKSVQT